MIVSTDWRSRSTVGASDSSPGVRVPSRLHDGPAVERLAVAAERRVAHAEQPPGLGHERIGRAAAPRARRPPGRTGPAPAPRARAPAAPPDRGRAPASSPGCAGSSSTTMPALVSPYTVRATSNSERPEHLGERVEVPRAVHRGEHLPLERHQIQRARCPAARAAAAAAPAGGATPSSRCATIRRSGAPPPSAAPRSETAPAPRPPRGRARPPRSGSSPSDQRSSSNTASSICALSWRSSSRRVIDAEVHEDVAQPPAVAAVLHAARAIEVGLGDLARADQPRAERLRIAPDRRGHHAAAVEADGAGRLPQLGGDPQHAALPAQVEQLEDVLDVQILERCPRVPRPSPPRPRRCAGGRARSARASAPATAYGPPGSSWTTRSHACTAWSNCRCRASAAPS